MSSLQADEALRLVPWQPSLDSTVQYGSPSANRLQHCPSSESRHEYGQSNNFNQRLPQNGPSMMRRARSAHQLASDLGLGSPRAQLSPLESAMGTAANPRGSLPARPRDTLAASTVASTVAQGHHSALRRGRASRRGLYSLNSTPQRRHPHASPQSCPPEDAFAQVRANLGGNTASGNHSWLPGSAHLGWQAGGASLGWKTGSTGLDPVELCQVSQAGQDGMLSHLLQQDGAQMCEDLAAAVSGGQGADSWLTAGGQGALQWQPHMQGARSAHWGFTVGTSEGEVHGNVSTPDRGMGTSDEESHMPLFVSEDAAAALPATSFVGSKGVTNAQRHEQPSSNGAAAPEPQRQQSPSRSSSPAYCHGDACASAAQGLMRSTTPSEPRLPEMALNSQPSPNPSSTANIPGHGPPKMVITSLPSPNKPNPPSNTEPGPGGPPKMVIAEATHEDVWAPYGSSWRHNTSTSAGQPGSSWSSKMWLRAVTRQVQENRKLRRKELDRCAAEAAAALRAASKFGVNARAGHVQSHALLGQTVNAHDPTKPCYESTQNNTLRAAAQCGVNVRAGHGQPVILHEPSELKDVTAGHKDATVQFGPCHRSQGVMLVNAPLTTAMIPIPSIPPIPSDPGGVGGSPDPEGESQGPRASFSDWSQGSADQNLRSCDHQKIQNVEALLSHGNIRRTSFSDWT